MSLRRTHASSTTTNTADSTASSVAPGRFLDCFDHVYVVNLPERTDRRRHIERQLVALGGPQRGDRITVVAATRPDDAEPFHRLGSKGAYLSAQRILRRAQSDGHDRILVLQDDALFTPEFHAVEQRVAEAASASEWDVVQFGHAPQAGEQLKPELGRDADPKEPELVPFDGDIILAHCLAFDACVDGRFADFLDDLLTRPRDHPDGGPMPIDGAVNVWSRRPDVTRLVLAPSLVGQASSRSDVSPGRLDGIPVLRPGLDALRRSGVTSRVRRVTRSLRR